MVANAVEKIVAPALRFMGVDGRVWSTPSENDVAEPLREREKSVDINEQKVKMFNMHLSECFCFADKTRIIIQQVLLL